MGNKSEYPDWFLWLWEKWVVLFLLLGVLTLILIAGAVYLDNRFERFEDQLKFVPPRSYEPPNLAEYQADNIDPQQLTKSGSIYAPCYSHIYYHGGSPLLLETTLSVRNIDRDQPVYLTSINYVDTDGESIKVFLDQTIKLEPFQTIEFLVEEKDSTGGSGANFIIDWKSEAEVEAPLVETVMVGASGSRAIAFSRTGVPISAGKADN
jgi:hypothetical protein